jgi:hypothetical protein
LLLFCRACISLLFNPLPGYKRYPASKNGSKLKEFFDRKKKNNWTFKSNSFAPGRKVITILRHLIPNDEMNEEEMGHKR